MLDLHLRLQLCAPRRTQQQGCPGREVRTRLAVSGTLSPPRRGPDAPRLYCPSTRARALLLCWWHTFAFAAAVCLGSHVQEWSRVDLNAQLRHHLGQQTCKMYPAADANGTLSKGPPTPFVTKRQLCDAARQQTRTWGTQENPHYYLAAASCAARAPVHDPRQVEPALHPACARTLPCAVPGACHMVHAFCAPARAFSRSIQDACAARPACWKPPPRTPLPTARRAMAPGHAAAALRPCSNLTTLTPPAQPPADPGAPAARRPTQPQARSAARRQAGAAEAVTWPRWRGAARRTARRARHARARHACAGAPQ